MTISKYVNNFIKQYETLKIDTNHVQEGSDKYGLYKSPGMDIRRNVDGTATITENYQFLAMQRSIAEAERQEDDAWLENFVYWVIDYPLKYEYPEIDGGRIVTDITVTGAPTPLTNSDDGIMYQISLNITYQKEV